MEIDKDRVVECARTYVGCILDKQVTCASLKEKERLFLQLRDALNPPPPRLPKEECIENLERYYDLYKDSKPFAFTMKSTIEYLKEPSLQWVKNTGQELSGNANVLVKLGNGKLDLGNVCQFLFNVEWSDSVNLFVTEYIILE